MRPRIGITLGDPAGIGPEILAKLLGGEPLAQRCLPLVIGDARVMQQALALVGADLPLVSAERVEPLLAAEEPCCRVLDLHNIDPAEVPAGEISAACGRAAGEFIARAVELALAGSIDAVVTNPIHKEAFARGGWGEKYAGHTEMLTDLTRAPRSCMMLASGALRVCHVTTHVSLLEALTRQIKRRRILDVIELADDACRRLGVEHPRIGVAGVNPHAGEDGLFGDEEQREVIPAVHDARERGIAAEGPIPADTIFSKAAGGMYDAVVAMYHDQGHIPVKLAGFRYAHADDSWELHGVNVTLGLPIVRTSVDHGTAFDKAGKGVASHLSLLEAVDYAIRLAGG